MVVDPQLTVSAYADDTYVMSGFHRDNSHDLELKVGTYDGGAHIGRSYMKFDTTAINGKVVNSAQFHIGESHSWNCASGWPTVHRVSAGWNGQDMQDWPGAPFVASPAGGVISATGSCGARTVVYDVTSAATHWAANPAQSFGLALETSHSDNNAWKKFKSIETGAPPRLEVTWSEPPPPSTGNPFGYLDLVYPFVGGVLIQGWAIDPDVPTTPIAVHVYNSAFVEGLIAGTSRPDVGAVFPGYGDNHGFYDFAPMAPGPHNVCVYGINVGAGTSSPLLGCRSVVVPARVHEPFGYLDNVDVIPGGTQVRGWAIDPNTAAPIDVQVWSDAGYVATLPANVSRPDVGPFGFGDNHGYDAFVALAPGYHNVCSWGINVGAGATNALLGCRQVVVSPANPPSAPTGAAAVANLDGSVRVTWGLSTYSGGPPIAGYVVHAYNADNSLTGLFRAECPTCTSASFTGLTPGASYHFGVYAYNLTYNGYTASLPGTTPTVVAPANGAGAMGYFSFDSYALTDTLSAHVNVGTGNLMISGADASVTVVGGAKGIGRTYNTASLAPGASAPVSPVLGPGWRFSESPDHRLVRNDDLSVTYITPSGANPTFIGTPLVAPKGFDATLVPEPDGTYTMTFPASAGVLRFRSDGLLSSETDRNGNVLTVAYPAGGGYPTTITGNAGAPSARTLNVAYRPDGRINSLSRTADGVTASVGYAYDAAGRLEKVTDAEGGLTTFVYDAANRITTITDAAAHVTRFTYDAASRVASVTREVPGANAVTRYDYATAAHTKVTDPNDNPFTDYTFAADGRLETAVDARGATTEVVWDLVNLLVTEVKIKAGASDPFATLITKIFEGLNLTDVVSPTGAVSKVDYGIAGFPRLPKSTTDSLGNQTSFEYDPKGNLEKVTAPVVGPASVERNADGTVWKAFSPASPTSNPTVYGYTNGQLTSVTPPTGNSLTPTTATYDGFGRLKTSVSGEGVTATFGYDRLDRVRTESHSDGTPAISYDYDGAGNLTARTDATGTTSYTYDAANRPLTKSSPVGNLSYTWDRAGNLTSATDPAGTTVYHYDKLNRLDQVTEPVAPGELVGRKNVFAYDFMGRRTDSWYNTGADALYLGDNLIPPLSFAVHTRATYDAASQLIGLKTTRASSDADANRVSELCYSYTLPAGTSCADIAPGAPTDIRHAVIDAVAGTATTYTYDQAGRLTNASTPGGPTYDYEFDANTNRTKGPEGNHTVNSGDQLTDTGFAYDHDGGLTAGGGLSFAYNGIGQTTSITQAGNPTAYTYAGGGQTERTVAGATTAVHGLLGLMTETTGGATTSYIRGPGGGLIAERTPVGDFYYVHDGRGSVIALVAPDGTQRAAYTYDPYGVEVSITPMHGALPPNPWRWSGSYLDATGLYKMGARYYDPILGRFTQVDPVAGGSANDYDYCSGDPVNCSDVTGTRGKKTRKPSPMEEMRLAQLLANCSGPDPSGADISGSGACRRFWAAYEKGDLSEFGIGTPMKPPSLARQFGEPAVYAAKVIYGCAQGAVPAAPVGTYVGAHSGPAAPYVAGAFIIGGCAIGVGGAVTNNDLFGPGVPVL